MLGQQPEKVLGIEVAARLVKAQPLVRVATGEDLFRTFSNSAVGA